MLALYVADLQIQSAIRRFKTMIYIFLPPSVTRRRCIHVIILEPPLMNSALLGEGERLLHLLPSNVEEVLDGFSKSILWLGCTDCS